MQSQLTGMTTPANTIAALLTLAPLLAVAFFGEAIARRVRVLPVWARLLGPAVLCAPYLLVACGGGVFGWQWLALYALLPVAVAMLLWRAKLVDRKGLGDWRDFIVLATLGLAVDLRWLEGAWPAHLAIFGKMLLLDAGVYGFILVRELDGVGFDLRLLPADAGIGMREAALYSPIALAVGLSLGFLHLHALWPGVARICAGWIFTFLFIAVPEELYFRGWMQNLMERRMGRYPALFLTAVLFGLSHFNKRAAYFNWRYVLLAALAGIFYGRSWRERRRIGASAITHATVDTIWSLWLR